MKQYLPYAGTNSIQEAVIALHFQNSFTKNCIDELAGVIKAELNEVFPKYEEIIPESMEANNFPGIQFSRIKGDDNLVRVLRIRKNLLTVNYFEYFSWQTTLQESLKYLKCVLSFLDLENYPVSQVSLRYVDQYSFFGNIEETSAELLFNEDTPYLNTKCFESGALWHCHSGWIDNSIDSNPILNQLNIGSAITKNIPTVTVDHNAVCLFQDPIRTFSSFFDTFDRRKDMIELVLDSLHLQNSNILKSLLRLEMLKRIGMQK